MTPGLFSLDQFVTGATAVGADGTGSVRPIFLYGGMATYLQLRLFTRVITPGFGDLPYVTTIPLCV